MVHFSLRVLVGKVLQSKDGCPIEHVGHDGGEPAGPGFAFPYSSYRVYENPVRVPDLLELIFESFCVKSRA